MGRAVSLSNGGQADSLPYVRNCQMLKKIAETISSECKLTFEQPILAAVSGGPDSMCLFDILRRLGYPIIVAHLDHQLRMEGAEEARKLAELAESSGISICLGQVDVASYAQMHALSIEEAA